MRRLSGSIFLIVLFLIFPVCFIQAQETLTISTYYPSPTGIYQRLATSTLGVGDNDASGQITNADAPDPTNAAQQGDVWIAGDVGIKTGIVGPQRSLHVAGTDGIRVAPTNVTTIPSPQVGDVAVDSTDSTLKWYNGSTWAAAGGGACYTAYWPYTAATAGVTNPANGVVDATRATCLPGYTDNGSLGAYGGCWYDRTFAISYFLPPNGRCCNVGYHDRPFYLGDAHLCCK